MVGFYLEHFAGSPSTLFTLVVLSGLAVVVAIVVPRRRAIVLATGLALALIGGQTLAPASGWTTFTVADDPATAIRTALAPASGDLAVWRRADGPANVVLFVPLGLALGLLLRRPVVAAVLTVVVSIVVEAYQAATVTRVGVFADVVANGLGGALGAALAAVVLLGAGLGQGRKDRGRDHRPLRAG